MHGRRLLDRIDMFGGASAGALVATVLALKTYDPRIIQVNTRLYCLVVVLFIHALYVTNAAVCSGGANSELHLLLRIKFSLIVWGFGDIY